MKQQTHSTLKDVIKTFFFVGVLLPLLMMGSVGAYGLIVWLLQMFVIGLPGA